MIVCKFIRIRTHSQKMTSWLRNKHAGRHKSAHHHQQRAKVSAPKLKVTQDQDDDVKRQINSDPHDQRPIYRLVDVKSGAGQLIELIKKAPARHGSSSQSMEFSHASSSASTLRNSQENQLATSALDEQIRALVEPLLYNQGRGKLIPLHRLWRLRLTGSGGGGGELEPEVDCESGSAGNCRRVCWRLEERGFVGETALHICFLLATPTHMILAQKLLRLFPSLINDIYTCDEYFGESSLHMAIVNENVKIVKLLLDHGASVHERCLGNFFLPDDQKTSANCERRRGFQRDTSGSGFAKHQFNCDNWTSNQLIRQTNYSGYTYWGEYALSFAASLGLADCYQLLLAKGADPNRRDSNGNSTLHLCVIANRLDMFDLCYSNGAQLDANLNNLHLSPLTLAAKLRRVEMFQHILTLHRKLNWILCNHVAFLDFPLQGIDSIESRHGSRDDQSLLAIVVGGNSNEHLQMLDGLLSDLLQVKWETSLRNKFYSWLAVYILMLVISSIAYVTRFKKNDQAIVMAQYASEILLLAYVICYLFILIKRCLLETTTTSNQVAPGVLQVNSDTSGALTQLLSQAPELIIHTFTCLLILACLPLRSLDWRQAEDFLAAIVVFLLPMKLLFFCRGSKSLGSFIVMIYRILVNDVLCFVVFLIIFISGFAQSFLIIFQSYRPPTSAEAFAKPSAAYAGANTTLDSNSEKQHLTSLFESIVKGESLFLNLFDALITMHMMALNEFSWVVDEFTSTDYPQLAKCLFCVYMILVSILLINMLIAMLGKTYQDISSQPNENLRQWARALLTVERICSPPSRLAMLDRYSHVIRTSGQRCYSTTWALGLQDLESINVMKQLKQEHQLNSQRLMARTIERTIKH